MLQGQCLKTQALPLKSNPKAPLERGPQVSHFAHGVWILTS